MRDSADQRSRLAEYRVGADEVRYPPEGSFRSGATLGQWYANPNSGIRGTAGLQKDQHPRGEGLLLRLAFLPGGRRRPGDRQRRRTVRASVVPLLRLGSAHVVVGADHGDSKVSGNGLHRKGFHRRRDVRLQLPQQRGTPRRARGRGGEVRAGVRAQSPHRHRFHAEGLLRNHEAVSGRISGQHAQRRFRVVGQHGPAGRRRRVDACGRDGTRSGRRG